MSNAEKFCLACIAGDAAAVKTMLQAEPALVAQKGPVHPDHRDFMRREDADGGWTPLHLAAHYRQMAIVELLLAHGAPLDAKADNGIGNTPLMAAIAGGDAAIVTRLLDAGADRKLRDKSGHDALELATVEGRDQIAALLKAR
jgi:hypothetical protein